LCDSIIRTAVYPESLKRWQMLDFMNPFLLEVVARVGTRPLLIERRPVTRWKGSLDL
jgi:hypothetical protein